MFEKIKNLPRKAQVAFAVLSAAVLFAAWSSTHVLKIVDAWRESKLERVNVIAATELFGSVPVETCSLKTLDAEVKVFDLGLLVRVRSKNGARQSQFFPVEGLDAFLAARQSTALDLARAFAAEGDPAPAERCIEKLVEVLPEGRALVECLFASGCVELYVVTLATGEIVERRSPPCPPSSLPPQAPLTPAPRLPAAPGR